MESYLGKKRFLFNHTKKPVLTLLGEKDGYFSYLNSIQEYYDLFKKDHSSKPVVIEKDINHLQMSDNIESNMAKFIQMKDCPSPITLEQAHHKLTRLLFRDL